MSLSRFAKLLSYTSDRAGRDEFRYFCPTNPQRRWFLDSRPTKALVAGNQIGKTAIGAYSIISHCLGIHPEYDIDPPPISALLICHSHQQKRIIEEKLWKMLPKHEIVDTEYRHGYGFVGVQSVVKFRNGSIIRILSAGSGAGGGLGGSTVNYCWIDEPVDESVYNELLSRISRGGKGIGPNGKRGILALTLTPVGGIDVSYLKRLIEDDKISVTRGKLSVEDTTPYTWDGRKLPELMSAKQVESIISGFLPIDREARVTGSLDGIAIQNLIFEHFDPEMISRRPVPKNGDYIFAIGIDHGTTPNSQVAILVCVDMSEGDPYLYVLDEYVSSMAPPETHARGILDMIERNGLYPEMLKWTGDGEHTSGRGKTGQKISNLVLIRAFERLLNFPAGRLPWRIKRAYKYKHSVYYGISQIAAIMARRRFSIQPRCKKTIESIKKYVIKPTNSEKSRFRYGHCVDALRYSCVNILSEQHRTIPRLSS